jgi:hypothetical protein
MAKSKKIKLFIGLFYISAVGLFLYFIFTKFSFQEITSYEFIKNNRDYFYDLRQTNLFLLGCFIYLIFNSLGFRCWLWFTSSFIRRFYFWKVVWAIVYCYRIVNWCNFTLCFCKLLFKRND